MTIPSSFRIVLGKFNWLCKVVEFEESGNTRTITRWQTNAVGLFVIDIRCRHCTKLEKLYPEKICKNDIIPDCFCFSTL